MKKLLLFLTLIMSGLTFSQQTAIPDPNFEQALIDLGYDSGTPDGVVLTNNIAFVTVLSIVNKNINDLTGIEAFENLRGLNCNFNQLTSLNIDQNTALTSLQCTNNSLTSLEVSSNVNLYSLFCDYNNLASLNLIQNTALTNLSYQSNNVNNIDLSQNLALTSLVCSNNGIANLDVSQNTALESIDASVNNLNSIDVSYNISLTSLGCVSNNLSNLDVSQNSSLTILSCGFNNLTSLNTSQNTSLEVLICSANNLSNLDVSQNIYLTRISCNNNNLTTLNVSSNTLLDNLLCDDNSITNLDLSNNTVLQNLDCSSNNLSSLGLKNGNNSNMLSSHIDLRDNPNLLCVEVDNVNYSSNTWFNKGNQTSFSDDCSNIQELTYVPDVHFEDALIDLGYDTVIDNYVITNKIDAVIDLDISGGIINDLTGIEAFKKLSSLNCSNNLLSNLDVSENSNLKILDCSNNNLTSLNLNENKILEYFDGDKNELTQLSINNGNNFQITSFSSKGNPNLKCVQVDDVDYFENNFTGIDTQTSFSKACDTSLSTDTFFATTESIYPNPATTNLTINLPETLQQVEIHTLSGRKVLASTNKTVNINHLSSGMYLVKITTQSGKMGIKKIVKR